MIPPAGRLWFFQICASLFEKHLSCVHFQDTTLSKEQLSLKKKKKKNRATNFPERGLLLLPTVNGGRVFKNTVIIITK